MSPGVNGHRPVLMREAIEGLNVRASGCYIDATFGRGGHCAAILRQLDATGRLLALDQDPEAVRVAQERFGADPRVAVEHASFNALEELARRHGMSGCTDGILFDLGVSSPQLEDAARGFSFASDGPLDMRMNPQAGVPASEWLASVSERELDAVLRSFGEERYHRRIARAIVQARQDAPIRTTRQLADVVARAVPTRERHKDPATRTFQAIRIAVNRELEALQEGMRQALNVLAIGGRLVVISFHSLEDRMVKRFIRAEARGAPAELPPDFPVRELGAGGRLRALGGPVRPSVEEVEANPRARSAIMRIAERLA
ncbi:MAG: 16S rRNA (cytosine(1402)-N(4))-methyltransferase RsmH [Gammaproteobacteria bacterium]|nr:16S rRNA (cytosine(1402)-N(4))-methyltransferase RsmH [Gammaproteobacteria bacterium]NIR98311.1 16S rRNA (cytosine(1402)-N(4))-methyltransferase RsmH [Gammaproteobacteria bacterium]NIT64058.1 16S rRNA (cytosine(1402)-N(4))-methyltransferase RsmH [Gammaproteobacteria bacterium]NIV20989.1 16S rRNA (cytosine(1402)-N(4))-methyltransferase RsmH [Gammaproteobacteria bacterium]NIX10386.1 16S rRNA (cytosine(1402)-N(4))-methyltransferase RsmH [Gammaproteobacteria bacterium]